MANSKFFREIPEIDRSLDCIRLHEGSFEDARHHPIVCGHVSQKDRFGNESSIDSWVYLTSEGAAEIPLPKLIEKVADYLTKVGHIGVVTNARRRLSLAAKVLALGVWKSSVSGLSTRECVNTTLETITPCNVIQWALLPIGIPEAELYTVGRFTYGRLDLSKLEARCRRAGSDYFDVFGASHHGVGAITFELDEVYSIDPRKLVGENKKPSKLMYRILDDYFMECADATKECFVTELDNTEAIFIALGTVGLSSNWVRSFDSFTRWVTVVTRSEKGHGWVTPIQEFPRVDFPPPSILNLKRSEMIEGGGLTDFGTVDLDSTIQVYSEYLVSAESAKNSGDSEGSILHMIFALDLLLGGEADQALVKTLSERVGVVTHQLLGDSFEGITSFVRDCYNKRSGYAHRGEKGRIQFQNSSITEVETRLTEICRTILSVALNVRLKSWASESALSRWRSRIDIMRNKRSGGEGWTETDFADVGADRLRFAIRKPQGKDLRTSTQEWDVTLQPSNLRPARGPITDLNS